jgi:hypothetical protein
MSGVLCSSLGTIRIAAWCGLIGVVLMVRPVSAWQEPLGNPSGMTGRPANLGGNREKDLLSRPVGEMLQADRNAAEAAVPRAAPSDRLTASDIFLLKIVGAILMVSLASLLGLKLLFSHGRKARSPIVGPSPTGSGPPDPDGVRWLSGTVQSVTRRESPSRHRGERGSDSSDQLAKPTGGNSPSRTDQP